MEGDQKAAFSRCPCQISTHALTWRATQCSASKFPLSKFLPTPSHGGRLTRRWWHAIKRQFLPTPSHGGRPQPMQQAAPAIQISTHALTWRATSGLSGCLSGCDNFYPRPHMEGDSSVLRWQHDAFYFYPRPHMEGDLNKETCEKYCE